MATRTRVSTVAGREKRGTSPSHTTATAQQQQRTSPSTSKTSSPAPSSTTTSDHKHSVPNYLKSTLSCGTDVNISKQQGKKPNNTTATRRSLDKPHNPTLRSSSFSGKTVPRQVHDKNLKTNDSVKQGGGSLYARPVNAVKKRTIYVKKQGTGSSSTSTTTKEHHTTSPPQKVENPNTPDLTEPETKTEDQVSSVTKTEEQITVDETKHEEKHDAATNEDQEMKNIEKAEAESDKDANIVNVESPKILEQRDPEPDVHTKEEAEEKPLTEEISSSKQQELELELEHVMNEIDSNTNDEVVTEDPKEVVIEKQEEEAAISKHKEEQNESKEKEVGKEEKKEAVSAAAPKVQQGKKESVVSNDVIEETASKLREQRKNKVKALAGAFETVISLQDPK